MPVIAKALGSVFAGEKFDLIIITSYFQSKRTGRREQKSHATVAGKSHVTVVDKSHVTYFSTISHHRLLDKSHFADYVSNLT